MIIFIFLIFFIAFIVLPTIRFLYRYSKEQSLKSDIDNFIQVNNELAKYSNNPGAFRRLNRIVNSDDLYSHFLSYQELHAHLCINFINMMKENASNLDISYVLEEMESIRQEYNKHQNIDILLFPAIIPPEKGIELFQEFQRKIQECEIIGNIRKGYAYIAWSITLIAHINLGLSSFGVMLWQELKRGFGDYQKNTSKTWVHIPRF